VTHGGGDTNPPRRFALDQNFPEPLLGSLASSIPEALLVPLRTIDPRLTQNFEDWEVLLALHPHSAGWDGLITTDTGMLGLGRELAVLMQTKLTLVIPQKAGHDPIRATGLLLTHLPFICRRTNLERAQLWVLSAAQRDHEDPWNRLGALADREKVDHSEYYDQHKLTPEQLAMNPLSVDLAYSKRVR
jgi:hypothetical protein